MKTVIRQASSLALVLCAGSIFLSCDKKDTPPETPGFHLFTNQIEITDATVKANFLKRSANKFPVISLVDPFYSADKVLFLTPDTVKFGTYPVKYSVVKKGNQHLFYSPRIVQYQRKNALIWDMLKYTAPRIPVSSFSGFDYITQDVRVGYGDAKQMEMPYLQYYWLMNNKLAVGWATGYFFNELSESVGSKVMGADTLAVKMSSVSIPVQ
ncbi:MAG: hypothetical protein EOO62_11345 [Hymenobacter sp.]|nr:MAG: hypothetical protein EOO62_11345 [Hymenobacter sp.]